MTCIFSVNTSVVGKDVEAVRRNNQGFRNVLDTLSFEHILDVCAVLGYATSTVLKEDGNRIRQNVAGLRVAQLDFDNTWSLEDALAHPFYQRYGIGLYSTPSHGKVQSDISNEKAETLTLEQATVVKLRVGQPMVRFRLVFVLEELLPASEISAFYGGLFETFPMADRSCRDAARLFFGSAHAKVRIDNPASRRICRDQTLALLAIGRAVVPQMAHSRPAIGSVISSSICKLSGSSRSSVEWVRDDFPVVLANGEVTNCLGLQAKMKPGYDHRLSCFSPFRDERRPSAFVTMDEARRLFFYDMAARKAYAFA